MYCPLLNNQRFSVKVEEDGTVEDVLEEVFAGLTGYRTRDFKVFEDEKQFEMDCSLDRATMVCQLQENCGRNPLFVMEVNRG